MSLRQIVKSIREVFSEASAEKRAQKTFAKELRDYAATLPECEEVPDPTSPDFKNSPRKIWMFVAKEIEEGTPLGRASYILYKDTLKLPPPKP